MEGSICSYDYKDPRGSSCCRLSRYETHIGLTKGVEVARLVDSEIKDGLPSFIKA